MSFLDFNKQKSPLMGASFALANPNIRLRRRLTKDKTTALAPSRCIEDIAVLKRKKQNGLVYHRGLRHQVKPPFVAEVCGHRAQADGFESGRPTKSRSVRTETDTAAIRNVYYTFVNLSSFGAFDGVDDVSLTINHTQGQGFGVGRDHAEARFGRAEDGAFDGLHFAGERAC